ncbi:MAG: TIM barrel protein [Actinobacteria bacterium]|nr:TIM barrel protein [Actinomycetota bacterium]
MRLGIAARLWSGVPFTVAAGQAAEAGYQGVEGVGDLARDPRLARRVLRDAGLTVTGGAYAANWFSNVYREIELDQIRRAAEFYAGLDCRHLITASLQVPERLASAGHFPTGRNDGLLDEQWGYLADSLGLAAYLCRREFDLTLHFRNQPGSYVETGDELDQLAALTDPSSVLLAPDTGYLFYAGVDPVAFVKRHRARIHYLTLKDVDGRLRDEHLAKRGDFETFVQQGGFCELGTGDVELDAVVEALRAAPFDGWLVVDQDHTSREPVASAQISRDYLAGLGL